MNLITTARCRLIGTCLVAPLREALADSFDHANAHGSSPVPRKRPSGAFTHAAPPARHKDCHGAR